ncbi:hypothetical protein [Bacillus massilinigeriensis]|uniref:hypothetical protein n=1 Tax=Bacillus massilionigeriensis TaxID=1805475 RepID=UPI00096B2CE6|nr:hypothetical protein [Bacillus massilionigeriensis]
MIKKIWLFLFLFLTLLTCSGHSQGLNQVEIFDLEKGKVIKTVPVSQVTQNEAEKYLKGINRIYVKLNPIPKKGHMIKIPLEPQVLVKNQWMESYVNEIIIVFPIKEQPYLMLFDDENNSHFLYFEGDTKALLNYLHSDPNGQAISQ